MSSPPSPVALPPRVLPRTVSDHLCIEFANSQYTDHLGTGRVYDRLVLDDWRDWFLQKCGYDGAPQPEASTEKLLSRLRLVTRQLLESRQPPAESTREELNRYLARSPEVYEVIPWEGGLKLASHPRGGTWAAAMAAVVRSYAELVSSGTIQHVRVCANPDCSWLFYDDTRNHSRRWCDATVCGNLMKVRRFRRH